VKNVSTHVHVAGSKMVRGTREYRRPPAPSPPGRPRGAGRSWWVLPVPAGRCASR